MSILRYCLDRRVVAVLGVIALAIALLAPRALGAALPVLLLAACPLSMIVIAVVLGRSVMPAGLVAPSNAVSMQAELDELAARQRRLEGELAASEAKGADQGTDPRHSGFLVPVGPLPANVRSVAQATEQQR